MIALETVSATPKRFNACAIQALVINTVKPKRILVSTIAPQMESAMNPKELTI